MRKFRFFYWYLPAIMWGGLLILLTSLPDLSAPELGIEIEDKIYHLLFYAAFAFLWARADIQGKSARFKLGLLRSGLFLSAFACLDELHQLVIPGRDCSFADGIADILGIILGLFLFKILFNRMLSFERALD